MEGRKLKIALVGCGQIADAHLQEIAKIPEAEAIAVCDRYLDLAEQAAARFGVGAAYDDFTRMLAESRPDVVHITTPPQSHVSLAVQAIRAGAHVYVEKPFTLNSSGADEIIEAAERDNRLVCVGHDHLFDPVWEECRSLVQSGQLGGVVHVESIQGYDLNGPFGRLLAAEPDHWVHKMPGGLFQNVISHPVYKLTEFIPDELPQMWATWFEELPGSGTPTELRVLMRGRSATANLMFSSTVRPVQRVARIYGTRGSVEVDLEGRTVRSYRALKMPGPFAKIEAPYQHFREAGRSLRKSISRFLHADIHYFAGMNRLFTRFYQSILNATEPPIPSSEIRRVTAWMDEIFRQCRSSDNGPLEKKPTLSFVGSTTEVVSGSSRR